MKSYGKCSNKYEAEGIRKYALMSLPDLFALIIDENICLRKRDEAMYYIVTERLSSNMRRIFEQYRAKVAEAFEDLVQDFYLYLRGDGVKTYSCLKSIRNVYSFDTWMVMTFRNFLSKKSTNEIRLSKDISESDESESSDLISQKKYINMLSVLVAYCCQEFNHTDRFIFLRMLLTLLDKSRAIPQDEMAQALGITDIYYRVMNHRLRRRVQRVKEMLLSGVQLPLTQDSRRFEAALNDDFSNWYQIIAECYDEALNSLVQSSAISLLRMKYRSQTSGLLHDIVVASYGSGSVDARTLWQKVGTFRESLAYVPNNMM